MSDPVHAEDPPYHRSKMGDKAFQGTAKDLPGDSFPQIVRQSVIGLAIAGLLLGSLEGLLRLARFEYRAPHQIIIWNARFDKEMKQPEGLYRFHPYWFWELRPGAKVADCGSERINDAGYRGSERPQSPTHGTLRVAVLGDSSSFGMGVCQDQTYAAVLERQVPGAEVLNFGVIGFTAFQGEKLLMGRVLAYHPGVILAAFGAIDELLPALGYDVDGKFSITSRARPWAVHWHDRLRDLRILQLIERALGRKSESGIELRAHENYLKWHGGSRDYMRNQSVESFERSLGRIVGLGRSHGARVVLIGPPRRTEAEKRWPWVEEYSAAIERVAAREQVPFWDARAAFRTVPNSDERLFLDDYHPNPAGHRMYAEFLARRLRQDLSHDGRTGKRE